MADLTSRESRESDNASSSGRRSRSRENPHKRSRHHADHERRSEKRRRDESIEEDDNRRRRSNFASNSRYEHEDDSHRRRRRTPTSQSRSRSRSPREHRHRHKHRDHNSRRKRSPSDRATVRSQSPPARSRKALPSQDQSYKGQDNPDAGALEKVVEKQKPNFKPTGLLAAETNKVSVSGGAGNNPKSIVLKYHEPTEARKAPSSQPWSAYVFKGDSPDPIETIPLHTRSCWLLGREAAVADIPTEHPSCSKQHAVFQFRYVTKKDEYGEKTSRVGLYIMDLESANGTFLNGERIEGARYFECLNNDVIKFGESTREFVILLPKK